MKKLKYIKLFENFSQEEEQEEEGRLEFPEPVTIRGNVYHSVRDLEEGENINLGGIINSDEGYMFTGVSDKPMTLDELVNFLNSDEEEDLDSDEEELDFDEEDDF